jgi:hypothetical protein
MQHTGGTTVENLTHNPKVKASKPDTGTGRAIFCSQEKFNLRLIVRTLANAASDINVKNKTIVFFSTIELRRSLTREPLLKGKAQYQ